MHRGAGAGAAIRARPFSTKRARATWTCAGEVESLLGSQSAATSCSGRRRSTPRRRRWRATTKRNRSARPDGGTRVARREPLAMGTRLGPYEVDCLIAAGGMGEVYRALDTRLRRRWR